MYLSRLTSHGDDSMKAVLNLKWRCGCFASIQHASCERYRAAFCLISTLGDHEAGARTDFDDFCAMEDGIHYTDCGGKMIRDTLTILKST